MVHRLYVMFLLLTAFTCAVVIGIRNQSYYTTSLEERPFHSAYDTLKPSGLESHGYGILGTACILTGVVMYSSRKRIRMFSRIGKIKYFLEFHIFLCLLGPILVMYHTTFKIGGLVAVAFWSMTAVALSGVIGRYLYVQIPKGIEGNELSVRELEEHTQELYTVLRDRYSLSEADVRRIDILATPIKHSSSIAALLAFFVVNDLTRRARLRNILAHLESKEIDPHMSRSIALAANERVKLLQRIAFLEELKNLFHYWHVIHLPFSIILLIILLVHIGVAVAFGYTWIW